MVGGGPPGTRKSSTKSSQRGSRRVVLSVSKSDEDGPPFPGLGDAPTPRGSPAVAMCKGPIEVSKPTHPEDLEGVPS